MSKFNPLTNTFENFSQADGLGVTEFNSGAFYKDNIGVFHYGGVNGLVSFEPNKLTKNENIGTIALVGLKANNRDLALSNNNFYEFEPGLQHLGIQMAASDYSNPSQNVFSYQINYEPKVSMGNSSKIDLINLRPGKYILVISGKNNSGKAFNNLRVNLVLKAHFWETNWFKVLLFLGMLAIIIFGFWLRSQYQNKLMMVRDKERESLRKQTAQDIHDEFGNALTRISMVSTMALQKLKNQQVDEATSHLETIGKSSQRLYQGSKDFVWAMGADSDSLFEVMLRLKDFAEETFDGSSTDFYADALDESWHQIKLEQGHGRQIVMLFKEAISNSRKHAKASKVNLSFNDSHIIWEDFSESNLEIIEKNNGQGMHNMWDRAHKIGKELLIEKRELGIKISLKL